MVGAASCANALVEARASTAAIAARPGRRVMFRLVITGLKIPAERARFRLTAIQLRAKYLILMNFVCSGAG